MNHNQEKFGLPLIQNADLKGKKVLVRVDHNVVKKGIIKDTTRIDASIKTINYILSEGGKPILMTHVGRPKDKKTGVINIEKETGVDTIVEYLSEKLNIKISTVELPSEAYSNIPNSILDGVRKLEINSIDLFYMPNTRWFVGEESKTEMADIFAKELGKIADVFVNDAFGSWQAHVSTAKITQYLPSYMGYLMQKEVENLSKIFEPKRPLISVVAGSKFDTKIESLNKLIEKSDYLVLGGVLYNAYLCAKYGISIKGIDDENLKYAKEFVEFSNKFPGKLVEMDYIIEADSLDSKFEDSKKIYIHDLKPGDKLNFILDVSKESFETDKVKAIFENAETIFVNAVMGFIPNFKEGTIALNTVISKNFDAMKLFGGGDTLQELKELTPEIYYQSLNDNTYYLFTGGGAVLTAIQEGGYMGLPPLIALLNSTSTKKIF